LWICLYLLLVVVFWVGIGLLVSKVVTIGERVGT
jgi:hypothetical protein